MPKPDLPRLAALFAALLLLVPLARGLAPVQDGTDEPSEPAQPALQAPQTVEEALAISSSDLSDALEGMELAELSGLLTNWLALARQQQAAYLAASADVDTTGDLGGAAQLATDRDVLIGQAEAILTAVGQQGGEVEQARRVIAEIRAATLAEESVSTVPVNRRTALELEPEVLKAMLRPLTLEQATEQMGLWLDLLQRKCVEVKNAEVSALRSEDAEEVESYNAKAVAARAERTRLISRVQLVISAVDKKGGDVEQARAYVQSVVVTPPITGARAAWTTAVAWMTNQDGGLALLKSLGMALAVVIASWVVARLTAMIARRALRKIPKASELLKTFIVTSVKRVVILLGVLAALGQLGVNMAPWLAAIGAAGLVVGLALQGTLSNFASGLMIMIYRPFDVGDVIATAGPTGKVEGMTLVTTTVKTFDNQTVHIPNNMVWGDVITNITANKTRRVDMVFGIGYGDDVQQAKEVLLDIVASHEQVLPDPEPVVRVHELGDSSVNFIVRPWVRTADYWDVYWGITQAVKERFDREGISIPFPQRDVHLIPVGGEPASAKLQPAAGGGATHEPGPADEAESEPSTSAAS